MARSWSGRELLRRAVHRSQRWAVKALVERLERLAPAGPEDDVDTASTEEVVERPVASHPWPGVPPPPEHWLARVRAAAPELLQRSPMRVGTIETEDGRRTDEWTHEAATSTRGAETETAAASRRHPASEARRRHEATPRSRGTHGAREDVMKRETTSPRTQAPPAAMPVVADRATTADADMPPLAKSEPHEPPSPREARPRPEPAWTRDGKTAREHDAEPPPTPDRQASREVEPTEPDPWPLLPPASDTEPSRAPSRGREARGATPRAPTDGRTPPPIDDAPSPRLPPTPAPQWIQVVRVRPPAASPDSRSTADRVVDRWPELPPPLPEPDDDITVHLRERDRLRRLDDEQRGRRWNE